jgi:hypothetical protein
MVVSSLFQTWLNQWYDLNEIARRSNVFYFVEIADGDKGTVSIVPSGKEHEEFNENWRSKYRQEIKLGKFLRKWLKAEDVDFTDASIENYVNSFKSFFGKTLDFLVVEGGEIPEVYEECDGEGVCTSCMTNYTAYSEYMEVYSDHPDQIKMLVGRLNGKICCRALVWHTDSGMVVLDNIYATDLATKYKAAEYGKSQGWWVQDVSGSFHGGGWLSPEDNYQSSNSLPALFVTVETGYDSFPYMDTFDQLFKGYGLSNTYHYPDKGGADRCLDDTEGNTGGIYCEEEDVTVSEDDAVYSDYYQSYVNVYNSTYCDCVDTYVLDRDVVRLHDGEYAPDDYEDMFEWQGDYYLSEDGAYCQYNECTVPEEDVVVLEDTGEYMHEDAENEDGGFFYCASDGEAYSMVSAVMGRDGEHYYKENTVELENGWGYLDVDSSDYTEVDGSYYHVNDPELAELEAAYMNV